jgi:hypothetical protein
VTYRERQRLADIQVAIDAICSHLQRGDLSDGLVFDAVRIRLLEIGEAVKATLSRLGIAGGAVYNALVALAAKGARGSPRDPGREGTRRL